MKAKWRFIDSNNRSPYYNMALDEALLEWHSKGEIPPTIRFYGWNPPTLSIGYFQKAEKEINFDKVKELGLGFVRRPTGGRGVLHDEELTYSVIVSEEYPNMPKTVTEAYRVISEGLLEGFRSLGLEAYFAIPRSEEEKNSLKNPRSSVCFDAPSWYELVVEGRKIAGSAQTRQKGVILQHGSILLEIDEDKLFSVFNYPNDRVKERMQRAFRSKAVAINAIAGRKISIEEAKEAFYKGFASALDIDLEPYTLSEEEEAYVEELARTKYGSDEWNFKR
ncbi:MULTISPECIES: lipoate--protein ligase family protein [Priestia]|jgi:lipoate-protein ligase A|uniref:Octanoyltransferase LipM n=6 Tax=Priestia TaxID=2800373 RepID=A0A1Q8V0Y5_PRIMG|nr:MULTISPECIES: biotin/lipoate A/B protein ligase family protein [Priestia]KRD89425.1 octanoyltransferase [Bacillus sp. Root147]KRF57758.1 octanoyltransferase [Bacillus sp. Soil531]MBK0293037.1 lipoate--protein ligase family protein [Bacillus sp. S34]MBU8850757.1 lipoate--protein ligase family protein [Bacillus sp. FJAT-26377]MBZ5478015.1 lipoate--protein ligase family protein [Bacillus sp. T_4]MCF6798359.1 lipoate--protein ligase family protein [Bacillus sp. ET1]MCJ7990752.1 lipoate--prote